MTQMPDDAGFESLLIFLQQERGFDFTGYKRPSLMRRVERRMQMLRLEAFDAYRDYLEVHPDEFALLFNAILINVTAFFRDPPAWDALGAKVLPALRDAKGDGDALRVWSAGCSSGEEAYSVAIALAEALGAEEFRRRVKLYATDADEHALAEARLGAYAERQLEGVAPELRGKYFELTNERWVFRPELRRSIIFGRHDLVQDAPISRLDLLVCRNTLMYFNAETQSRIVSRFHFALNGDGHGNGYLFLGRAEMLISHANLFVPLDLKARIFAKVPAPTRLRVPATLEAPGNGNGLLDPVIASTRLRELALEESPVARIVVDANGLLVLANARARVLFSINLKDIGRPLQDLEISYRPAELRGLIEHAYAERRAVTQAGVERRFQDGDPQSFDVVAAPLFDEGQTPIGVSVTFVDVTRYSRLSQELQRSREEIQTTTEELQSSNEELETTNEELQSSNEELETTNEELQSTNEELETMNEELQSTNEELQALNVELRQRTDDMDRLNAFLHSVLGSLRSGAIVVNRNLDVLMWNEHAQELWGLRADEVQGKSLLNLDIGLPVAELRALIRPCLGAEADHAEATLAAVNRRGKKIRCHVTCTPLVTAKDGREGVIILTEEAP